jgi:hypothetical protein
MRQLLCSTLALTCAALPLGNASAEMHRLQLRFSDQVNVPTTTAAARRILGQDVTISDFDERFKPQADGKTYRLEAEIPMPSHEPALSMDGQTRSGQAVNGVGL